MNKREGTQGSTHVGLRGLGMLEWIVGDVLSALWFTEGDVEGTGVNQSAGAQRWLGHPTKRVAFWDAPLLKQCLLMLRWIFR